MIFEWRSDAPELARHQLMFVHSAIAGVLHRVVQHRWFASTGDAIGYQRKLEGDRAWEACTAAVRAWVTADHIALMRAAPIAFFRCMFEGPAEGRGRQITFKSRGGSCLVRNALVVQSSGRMEGSYSRLLIDEFVGLLSQRGGLQVVTRDLAVDPVPTLQPGVVEVIRALHPDGTLRATAALSERLIDEIRAADLLIIGAPMYNWGIPGALKAWIDQIVRIGYTFTVGSAGLEGLLGGKPAVVVLTRGGVYSAPERRSMDFQMPYLDLIFSRLGFAPEFVLCEGTLFGEETLQSSLATARSALSKIAKRYA